MNPPSYSAAVWAAALLFGATLAPAAALAQAPGPLSDTVPEAAPDPETERVLVPFAFYTPETRIAVGGLAGFYRRLDPGLPVSSLVGSLTVTTRKQLSTELRLEAFLPAGSRFEGEVGFRHFPDRFFGVGPATPDEAEEAFTSRIVNLSARAQYPVRGAFRIGPQLLFHWEDVVEVEEEGLLEGGGLTAAAGGRWLGLGLVGSLDSRDDLLFPRTGGYVEVSASTFPEAMASSTGYRRGSAEARRYVPLGESSVLALRGSLEVAGGEVPVLLLPRVGGSRRLRGYYEGRLRDRAVATAQTEVRFPVRGRLGAAVFAEVGQVAPRLGDLALGDPEYAFGGGLRFRVTDGGVRLRADFAAGRRGSGLYMTIGEAF